MDNKFELVDAKFGKDIDAEIDSYVEQQLEMLVQSHHTLHTDLIPKWRKTYLGKPAEESRNFPFPNAANTIVQVVGESVDAMVARVMGLLYATHPLWAFKNYSVGSSDDERKNNETERRALEDFMDVCGIEPAELNLHEVEALLYTDTANLGTGFIKLCLEDKTEAVVTGYTESKGKFKGTERTIYAGPRVINLRHEDVVADAKMNNLEDCDLVAVRHKLSRFKLEERGFLGQYDPKKVTEILSKPDRTNDTVQERDELQDQGVSGSSRPDVSAQWDIWECYLPWYHNGRKYRLIVSYHKASKTVLRKVFNFLPDNELPVKRAKYGYRTHGLYGHGNAELLGTYQEELSTIHNQRLDNATVANVRALRISPRARALDANTELYPAALLIGEKDEIEAIQVGDVYPSTFKNEELTLQLARGRASVSPAIAGAGTGSMVKQGKGSTYSAQGTLAVMQDNNSSVGFATSEFRNFHARLGSSLAKIYGKFGTFGKEEMFGVNSKHLQAALDKFAAERLRIPIRATNAAINREAEKQAGIVMAGLLQRHYTAVAQLLQAVTNPMAPDNFKKYAISTIVASEQLHRKIVKDFGYDQGELYVPEAEVSGARGGTPPQGAGGRNMAPGGPPMAGANADQQGGQGLPVPNGNVGGVVGGIAPLPGAGGGGRP